MATPYIFERRRHGDDGIVSAPIRSTTSILAILAAIGSFVLSGKGHEFLGMFAALFAIGAGFVGGLRSLSPRVAGGMLSLIAILMGLIGIVFSLLALIV